MAQNAIFELLVTTRDFAPQHERWNGEPMASNEASKALWDAVDAFKAALEEHGFAGFHISYGVRAKAVPDAE